MRLADVPNIRGCFCCEDCPTEIHREELKAGEPELSLTSVRNPPGKVFFAFCLAAIALVLGAYSNSLHNSFHFDDSHVIANNLFIRSLANIPRFFTDAQTFSASQQNAVYRPVVSLSLAWDYWLAGGLDPFWFHVTQLTLLVATGAMLFLLYRALFESTGAGHWGRWAALFAAALFCVHTGNTQTANYISARSELLSGLGVLGGFLIYIHRAEWRRYYLYLIPVILGALAKTPAVMFAPLVLVYILLIERQLSLGDLFTKRAWPEVRGALLSVAPVFVFGGLVYAFVESMNPPGQSYGGAGRMLYLATQTWVWVRYVRLFFVPTGLTADSDLRGITSWTDPRLAAGLLLLAVSLVALWRTSRSRELRPVAFGIAWFWIALIPSSSVFPLAEVTNDHRMFFPFMGLTAAVVWWICVEVTHSELADATRQRLPQITAAAALVILGGHAIATYRRNRVWLNEETLWQDVVAKSPRNPRGLMNYGLTQMAQGRYAVAREYFTRAYGISPNYAILSINLGIVTEALGDSSTAEEWFQRALTLDPSEETGHSFFANWLVRHGRAPEAITHLEKAAELSSADVHARHALLDLYAAGGDSAKLQALVRQTLEAAGADSVALEYSRASARPTGTSVQWFQRGLAHTNSGRHAEAVAAYRIALAKDSTNADAWNNLGWSLGKLGFFPQAVSALEHAIRWRPNYTLARNNLAWAKSQIPAATFQRAFQLHTSGREREAIPIYRALLEQNPDWVNVHYNLGHALMSIGQCDAAIAELEKTLQLQPNYPLAHLHLSTCLQRLGREQEAARHLAIYERATRVQPTDSAASGRNR
jgi:protein O-mannosyl-transferase